MEYYIIGGTFLSMAVFALVLKKDLLKVFYWNRYDIKDEIAFMRFQGINYMIIGSICILYGLSSNYISNIYFVGAMLFGALLYRKQRKEYYR